MYLVPFIALSSSVLFIFVQCDDMFNAPMDTRKYFSDLGGDMTKVTWVHRCNSRAQLESALASDVMMIEADIIAGHLKGDSGGPPLPVMGHPPETTGDISLEQFLDVILQRRAGKGIKLDFKSTAIFKASENVLEQFLVKAEADFPVWINADILRGPGVSASKEVVDATYFLRTCVTKFPMATISAGWAVDPASAQTSKYSSANIDEMTTALAESNVVHPVTFPVHSGIASNSLETLAKLVHTSVDGTSLTLWAHKGDWVDYNKLQELVKTIGKDKIFVDMPKDMTDKLNGQPESKGAGVMLKTGVGSLALIGLGVLCVSLLHIVNR